MRRSRHYLRGYCVLFGAKIIAVERLLGKLQEEARIMPLSRGTWRPCCLDRLANLFHVKLHLAFGICVT